MKKCPNCGNEYPEIIGGCPVCSTQKQKTKVIETRNTTVKSKGKNWFIVLIQTILIFILCVGLSFVFIASLGEPSYPLVLIVEWIVLASISCFVPYLYWIKRTSVRYGNCIVWHAFTALCIILNALIVSSGILLSYDLYTFEFNYWIELVAPYMIVFSAVVFISLIPYRKSINNVAVTQSCMETPRKIIWTLFVLSFFIYGYQSATWIGCDFVPDGIDRSSFVYYNSIKSSQGNIVYVDMKEGYAYHSRKTCTIEEYLTGKETHFKEISEYEANRRGFFKCPECYDSRSALYEIESDIESLKDSVYDLYPLVIE